MEFNFSTFIFEIINFLILVWILQRFLYKPVMEAIEQRRQNIEQSLTETHNKKKEAERLQSKYENRLAEWEQEKKRAMESLHLKIENERTRLLKKLDVTLKEEHKKAKVVEERHLREALRKNEQIALKQGAHFAGLLLKRAAGPELETRLFDALISDLSNLKNHKIHMLQSIKELDSVSIQLVSAFELKNGQRKIIERSLDSIIESSAIYQYQQDPELIAGFHISIGPWVLKASLQDELSGFAEIANESE